MSSVIICFVTSFDEFAIASFLAPSGQPTYPIFLYASARTPALLPEVIAIGAIIIAGSLLLVVLAEAGRRWAERRLVGVSLVSLTKHFGQLAAVDSIDLEIPSGGFFSLLGPSGCGKTTTLRLIAGFEQPSSGRVLLDGRGMARTPAAA